MKLALFSLMCFFSIAWQQNVQWALPAWGSPYYNRLPIRAYGPIFASQSKHLPYPSLIAKHHEESHIRTRTNANQRAFGLSGINYLASIILNSLSLTATSTSFTTSTSTITGATVVTCLTSTMFSATTACRRKRESVSAMLIGDHYDHNTPFTEENTFDILHREGRDINPDDVLASSWIEQDLDVLGTVPRQTEKSINRYVRKLTSTVTSTSVLTAFSVSVQTSTTTVTNLASSAALSCLPTGFTLC